MSGKKDRKHWLLGICSSEGNGVYLARIFSTKEAVLSHLLDLIKRDKEADLSLWDYGTESVNELIEYEDGSYNGYNCFNYYHVEYTVIEEMMPEFIRSAKQK